VLVRETLPALVRGGAARILAARAVVVVPALDADVLGEIAQIATAVVVAVASSTAFVIARAALVSVAVLVRQTANAAPEIERAKPIVVAAFVARLAAADRAAGAGVSAGRAVERDLGVFPASQPKQDERQTHEPHSSIA